MFGQLPICKSYVMYVFVDLLHVVLYITKKSKLVVGLELRHATLCIMDYKQSKALCQSGILNVYIIKNIKTANVVKGYITSNGILSCTIYPSTLDITNNTLITYTHYGNEKA